MIVKRYKMRLAVTSEKVRAQFTEYAKVASTKIAFAGPYVEQDLQLDDACDQTIVDDMHARMLADGWEFVEDSPTTQPTVVCNDADGNEKRLEDTIKDAAAARVP